MVVSDIYFVLRLLASSKLVVYKVVQNVLLSKIRTGKVSRVWIEGDSLVINKK